MKHKNLPRRLAGRQVFPTCLLTLLLVGGCLLPSPSLAHKLRVFAWITGDTVTVESSFSGGRTLVKGTVVVQDASTGASLVQGTTDEQGNFSFSLREAVKGPGISLRIVVAGGEGHQNEWILKPEEYQVTAASSVPEAIKTPQSDQTAAPAKDSIAPPVTGAVATPPSTITREELVSILDERLEAKLAPLRRSLAQAAEHRPQFTDILGGIGYIIGIAGILAWMKSKK